MHNIKKIICIIKLKSQINEYNFNSEIFNNLKLNKNCEMNFFLSIQKFRILFTEKNHLIVLKKSLIKSFITFSSMSLKYV